MNRIFSAAAGYAKERRNYNEHFNERDSESDVVSLEAVLYPLRRLGLRVRPHYEHEKRTSRADLGATVVLDDDVGFNGNLFGLDAHWLWGPDPDHRRSVQAWYEIEKRSFVTNVSSDVGHFDRRDEITQFGASWERELGRSWKARVAYRRRSNDVSVPSALGGRSTTTFPKNVIGASFVHTFDRHLGRGKGTAGGGGSGDDRSRTPAVEGTEHTGPDLH